MKRLKAEVFTIEVIKIGKFVAVGEIKVTYKEWKENRGCCGKKGMIAIAKRKAREKFKKLKEKSIIVVHKEYIFEEGKKIEQNVSGNMRPCIHCNTMNYATSSRCKKCGKHPKK